MRRFGATAALLVAVAAGGTITRFYLQERVPELPELFLDPTAPPLITFESSSHLDPGMVRVLFEVERPDLGPLRRDLPRTVSAVFEDDSDDSTRDLVAFTEVWECENVVEIRIPLTKPTERDRRIELRVGPVPEPFHLRPRDLPSAPVGVREIVPLEGGGTSIAIVNRTDSVVSIDGLRVNGRPIEQHVPIELPVDGGARVRVGGASTPAANLSVVLSADGRWIQAHEVARAPELALLNWEDFESLAGHGGTVAEVAVDVCNIELERGMPAGSYLADMRGLIREAMDDARRAESPGRSHAFVFLNDGGRPVSHFVYGRLSDFVGVAALDPRLSTTDLRDVAFWLRFDRRIVEPRHLLVLPGVLERSSPAHPRLEEQDLRRLVLASLSVGPRCLANYWPDNDPTVVAAAADPGYAPAMARIKAELEPLRAMLRDALPVDWIHGESGEGTARDVYGTTGTFALWTPEDRLIVIDLGYRERAWLDLPEGIRIAERVAGSTDVDVVRESPDGLLELRDARPGVPCIAAFRLAIEYFEHGDLEWLIY